MARIAQLLALALIAFPFSSPAASLAFTAHSLNLDPGNPAVANEPAQLLACDGQGNGYQAATVADSSGRAWIRVTKTNPQGAIMASFQFGGTGTDTPSAIRVDSRGDVVVAGSTTSADFPVTATLSPPIKFGAAFVVKLDAALTGIVASTLLGGSQFAPNTYGGPGATGDALYIDPAGNLYLAGSTAAQDFPVTPGAYKTAPPEFDNFGATTDAFVAELSPDLTKIIYATYYGPDRVDCEGSNCIGANGLTDFVALAVDASGAIVAAARMLLSREIPISGTTTVKFAPGGASLAWSSATMQPLAPGGWVYANALALDAAGDVILVGAATVYALAACAGDTGFVASLSGSTGALQSLNPFGCESPPGTVSPSVNSVAIDSSGAIWIAGVADPSMLPTPDSPVSGPSYVAALAPDGATVQALYTAPAGIFGQALALTSAGDPAVLGSSGFLMLASPSGGPSLLAVTNAAGGPVSGLIAPAEFVSFYGTGLGPATPLSAQFLQFVAQSTLGGYQLQIGGVAAPLLYIGPNQINAIVPSETAGKDSVPVSLVTPSGTFALGDLFLRPSQPQIFLNPTTGYAAAVNQDGQLNSATSPAHAGEVVSIWATGAGAPGGEPFPADGMIVPGPGAVLSSPALPVSVLSGNNSLEVDYAGDSPGEVFGLLQVNFRAPQQLPTPSYALGVSLQVGAAISGAVSIYVAP